MYIWLAVHLIRPVKGQRLDNLAVFFGFPAFCNCYGFFLVFDILNFRQINSTQLNTWEILEVIKQKKDCPGNFSVMNSVDTKSTIATQEAVEKHATI